MSLPDTFLHTLALHLPLADDHNIELIQPLWNDYGYCVRCTLQGGDKAVVKAVILPDSLSRHPKGWTSQTSHSRKCRSFDVEQCFYQDYLNQSDLPATATPIQLCKLTSGWLFALSDLTDEGYTQTHTVLSVEQSVVVLDWLAQFHAAFLGHNGAGLWQQGSYWHLATRQDELKNTRSAPLKAAAKKLDQLLTQCPYQTIIHGDAKVANFCFTPDFEHCAAIDFQYPGCAPGIVDVAYFIGSALTDADQLHYWQTCLDHYFASLDMALANKVNAQLRAAIETTWRELYPVACADFHRFLSGWSPSHWKINQHLRQQTDIALHLLHSGPSS